MVPSTKGAALLLLALHVVVTPRGALISRMSAQTAGRHAEAPVSSLKKPAAQLPQLLSPAAAWYVPAAQLLHPDLPDAVWNVPAAHARQAVAPVAAW